MMRRTILIFNKQSQVCQIRAVDVARSACECEIGCDGGATNLDIAGCVTGAFIERRALAFCQRRG